LPGTGVYQYALHILNGNTLVSKEQDLERFAQDRKGKYHGPSSKESQVFSDHQAVHCR
jgi:hypothetical protein